MQVPFTVLFPRGESYAKEAHRNITFLNCLIPVDVMGEIAFFSAHFDIAPFLALMKSQQTYRNFFPPTIYLRPSYTT